MNFAEITREYYSLWLGESDLLSRLGAGVHFVPSSERNHAQYGYSVPFQLYAFCQPNRVILSYGDALAEHIDWLKEQPLDGAANVKAAIQAHFSGRISHSRKYVMSSLPSIKTRSRALTSDDLSHFCSFNGKSCIAEDWFREYFADMVAQRLCWGYFLDGQLVSCSDAPGMPYLADRVQEIGINTLPAHRGRGYAADVCIAAAREIISQSKCPIWSANIDNLASQKLAERVGFIPFAEVVTLTV